MTEHRTESPRILAWFSAGAASAVATKLTISEYGHSNVTVAYCDTGSEHPDNKRFITDCEQMRQADEQYIQEAQQNINEALALLFMARRNLGHVNGDGRYDGMIEMLDEAKVIFWDSGIRLARGAW